MKIKTSNIVIGAVLVSSATAQISLNLSDLLSDAQSLYTEVTSVLGNAPTTTSTTSSRSTTSTSSSRTSSSSTSRSSSTSASSASAAATPTSSEAAQSTAASAAAAAASGTSNGGGGGGGGTDILPIVLGCTLGALALAAFLALLFFCRRRSKRRSKAYAKHRSVSSSDDESEIWNREKPRRSSFKGPTEHTRALGTTNHATATPLMTHHGQAGHHVLHGQPANHDSFGSTPHHHKQANLEPNLRNGGQDPHLAHPFSPDHVQAFGHHSETPTKDHYGGSAMNAVAAGVGGAALGGIAAHTADRRSESRGRGVTARRVDSTFSEDDPNTLPQVTMGNNERRSGSVSRASTKEPWPFMDAHERRSTDSSRSRPRSMTRAQEQFATPEEHPRDKHTMPSGAALIGSAAVGGLVGAAAGHKARSASQHRKGILKQTAYDQSNSSTSSNTHDATDRNTAYNSNPHELASANIPPIMSAKKERRHSPLGTAAPFAAKGANHSPDRTRRRSWSNGPVSDFDRPASLPTDSSQDSDIPHVPSRSPRRNSLHSNARYATENEGTVELPSGEHDYGMIATNRGLVSPPLEPHHGPIDSDGVVSPISPDISLPGTWSNAEARELGMNPVGVAGKSFSQESTAVESTPLNSHSDSNSDSSGSSKDQSSGLVSAIQRIFNSQKQAWPAGDNVGTIPPPRRSLGDRNVPVPIDVYGDNDNRRISSVPHRKPAPVREPHHQSQYGELNRDSIDTSISANENATIQQTPSRQSGESARSVPLRGGRYYARVNSMDGTEQVTVPATTTVPTATIVPTANTSATMKPSSSTVRPRSTSAGRSGYGLGSGDPFDLARFRTDSSMTGISLSNYAEPPNKGSVTNSTPSTRPRAYRSSSSSNDYREPTLAELKREVEEEDRQRRASWKSVGRGRKSIEGQRYGNDKELFDLAMPGIEQYDHFYGTGYGQGQGQSMGHSVAVGRAL